VKRYTLFIVLLGILVLIFIHGISSLVTYHKVFPKNELFKKIVLEGEVVSLPENDIDKTQFLFETKFGLVSLYWSKRFKPAPVFKPGQKWQLIVKLKEPRGFLNRGLFNYGDWLKRRGVLATGYIDVNKRNLLIDDNLLSEPINKIRYQIQQELKSLINDSQNLGLIEALILGDKSGLSKSQKHLFQSTGTSHLIAISGLHIGLIFIWFFFLARIVWSFSIRLCRIVPAQIFGMWVGLGTSIFYSLLADFAVSTQRAIIMLAVYVVTRTIGFNLSARRILVLAFILVVVWQPLSIFDAGFWLSFTAVGFLIYCLSSRVGHMHRIKSWIYPQFMIVVALVPLTIYWFGSISLIAILANLIVIPLVGFIIVPGAFISVVFGCFAINTFTLLSHCLTLLYYILSTLSMFNPSFAINNGFSYSALFIAMLGMILLFSPKGFRLRLLGVLMLCPLFFYQTSKPDNGVFRLYVLDVGQGLAAIIETKNHIVVYDTGPRFYSGSTAAEIVLVPFLKKMGISKVDILVISHSDLDHSGGLSEMLINFEVEKIYLSQINEELKDENVDRCDESILFEFDSVKFEFLNPLEMHNDSDNNLSCVLKASNHSKSVLLPGDIEKEAEKYLLEYHHGQIESSILVAPHHGSNSSSISQFILVVSPEYVVYAAGYMNHYHFPSLKVVERYRINDTIQLNTGNCGSIIFDIGSNIKVDSYVSGCKL
jgi:competence protein ComEC